MEKKKICIVVTSLGIGGAERSSALLSTMLDNLGYNVHIVSVLNDIEYEYKGTLLNLGEFKDREDTFKGRFRRYIIFKNYLETQKFDLIIDNRTRPTIIKEYLINRLLYKSYNVVYVARSSKIELYFTKSIYWAKKIFKNALVLEMFPKASLNPFLVRAFLRTQRRTAVRQPSAVLIPF